MAPAQSVGCVIYGLSAYVFCTIVLAMGAYGAWANYMRRSRLAHLSWGARWAAPKTGDEKRRERIALWLLPIAMIPFLTGVLVEFFGLGSGLFQGQNACPEGWPQPRALHALN